MTTDTKERPLKKLLEEIWHLQGVKNPLGGVIYTDKNSGRWANVGYKIKDDLFWRKGRMKPDPKRRRKK